MNIARLIAVPGFFYQPQKDFKRLSYPLYQSSILREFKASHSLILEAKTREKSGYQSW